MDRLRPWHPEAEPREMLSCLDLRTNHTTFRIIGYRKPSAAAHAAAG
jgi:hypothetical protein